MTNFKYLDKYLALLRLQNSSPYTRKGHGDQVKSFYRFLEEQGIEDLKEVGKNEIEEYQSYLYYYRTKEGKGLKPTTQLKRLTVLRSFFRILVNAEYLPFNPAHDLELPRCGSALPRDLLNAQEIKKILKIPDTTTVYGYRDRAMLEVLYSTGVRTMELAGLTVEDINSREGYLRIIKGKGQKDRTVPLGETAANYLKEYIQSVRPHLLKENSGEILFLTRTGRAFDCSSLLNNIKSHVKAAGINKNVTAKSFRVSMATEMLRGRADIRQIQEMLGHKYLSTTQVYLRIVKDDLKRVHRKTHPRERIETAEEINTKDGIPLSRREKARERKKNVKTDS